MSRMIKSDQRSPSISTEAFRGHSDRHLAPRFPGIFSTVAYVNLHSASKLCTVFRLRRRSEGMSTVRVLVGTKKGAFVLTSDGKREKWDVSGPHFAGWEIYHMKGSPVDPT